MAFQPSFKKSSPKLHCHIPSSIPFVAMSAGGSGTVTGIGSSPSGIVGGIHYYIEPELIELKPSPAHTKSSQSPTTTPPQPAVPATPIRTTGAKTLVIDKTLAGADNLAKLLPTGTFLAFQTLSPSFANKGHCYTSNKCLSYALLFICVLSCAFFTFTDSLVGRDGRHYYGVATSEGLYVLNFYGSAEERGKVLREEQLRRLRRRWVDWLHAAFGVLIFLALAFSDADIQSCLFPNTGVDAKELLVNLPLGAGVFASLVFMILPSSRKGIGYYDAEYNNNHI